MISFPQSTSQVVQTLVSGQPQGRPDNQCTLYSNWERFTDSRLGNPDLGPVFDYMTKNETHILPLGVFIRLFPGISQTAQHLNQGRTLNFS